MLTGVDAINKYVNMFKDCKISLKNEQSAHRYDSSYLSDSSCSEYNPKNVVLK